MKSRAVELPKRSGVIREGKTAHERNIIRALRALAGDWPPGISLFAWNGRLKVCRAPAPDDGTIVVVADIDGIPCDGGDPYGVRE